MNRVFLLLAALCFSPLTVQAGSGAPTNFRELGEQVADLIEAAQRAEVIRPPVPRTEPGYRENANPTPPPDAEADARQHRGEALLQQFQVMQSWLERRKETVMLAHRARTSFHESEHAAHEKGSSELSTFYERNDPVLPLGAERELLDATPWKFGFWPLWAGHASVKHAFTYLRFSGFLQLLSCGAWHLPGYFEYSSFFSALLIYWGVGLGKRIWIRNIGSALRKAFVGKAHQSTESMLIEAEEAFLSPLRERGLARTSEDVRQSLKAISCGTALSPVSAAVEAELQWDEMDLDPSTSKQRSSRSRNLRSK